MKTCTKCGESKPLDSYRMRSNSTTHYNTCRACEAAANAARKRADPEAQREKDRAYRAANPELFNRLNREYYERVKETRKPQMIEYNKRRRRNASTSPSDV